MIETLNVLLVDDDFEFGMAISQALIGMRYKVHFQNSLAGINTVILQFTPDIIVLDVNIGGECGIDKAKELFSLFPFIPILFISSRTDIDLVIRGIDAGGVNYLEKPLNVTVLDAYIRRFARKNLDSREIRISRYLLKSETKEWFYGNYFIKVLAPMEKNGLILLWRNKNSFVALDHLAKTLWVREYAFYLDARIHNLISRLRKLIERDEGMWIKTESEKGYQLTVL